MHDGVSKIHSRHLWSKANPHASSAERYHICFTIIMGNVLTGPCVLPCQLDSKWYCFLQTVLLRLLEHVPVAVWWVMVPAQQCGITLCGKCWKWLDVMYPGRWIGHVWPIVWPPQLPVLTLLDFFLWGTLEGTYVWVSKASLIVRLHSAVTDFTLLLACCSICRKIAYDALPSFSKCSMLILKVCCVRGTLL